MISEKAYIRPTGKVIATNIPYEEFLTKFEGQHVEWVYGEVIEMSPVTTDHNALSRFLISLFDNFLMATTGGEVFHDPMVMRPTPNLPGRAPNIQIVLPENLHIVKQSEIAGAADLIVEIVSKGSHRIDRIEKFQEYERAGVKEYWILDPIRRESLFYQLNDEGFYTAIEPDEQGVYHSKVLAKFKIHADIFWQGILPRGSQVNELVQNMLKKDDE